MLIFQIVTAQNRVNNTIEVTRVFLTQDQIQERNTNFIRPNDILITIQLNEHDHRGRNRCLIASVSRQWIDNLVSEIPQNERTATIYNWMTNLGTRILETHQNSRNQQTRVFSVEIEGIRTRTSTPREEQTQNIPPTTQRTTLDAVPRALVNTQDESEEILQQYREIISIYSTARNRAIANQPDEQSRIDQNYRQIFYGPSQEREDYPGSVVSLADQINRNTILSQTQKEELIGQLENVLSQETRRQIVINTQFERPQYESNITLPFPAHLLSQIPRNIAARAISLNLDIERIENDPILRTVGLPTIEQIERLENEIRLISRAVGLNQSQDPNRLQIITGSFNHQVHQFTQARSNTAYLARAAAFAISGNIGERLDLLDQRLTFLRSAREIANRIDGLRSVSGSEFTNQLAQIRIDIRELESTTHQIITGIYNYEQIIDNLNHQANRAVLGKATTPQQIREVISQYFAIQTNYTQTHPENRYQMSAQLRRIFYDSDGSIINYIQNNSNLTEQQKRELVLYIENNLPRSEQIEAIRFNQRLIPPPILPVIRTPNITRLQAEIEESAREILYGIRRELGDNFEQRIDNIRSQIQNATTVAELGSVLLSMLSQIPQSRSEIIELRIYGFVADYSRISFLTPLIPYEIREGIRDPEFNLTEIVDSIGRNPTIVIGGENSQTAYLRRYNAFFRDIFRVQRESSRQTYQRLREQNPEFEEFVSNRQIRTEVEMEQTIREFMNLKILDYSYYEMLTRSREFRDFAHGARTVTPRERAQIVARFLNTQLDRRSEFARDIREYYSTMRHQEFNGINQEQPTYQTIIALSIWNWRVAHQREPRSWLRRELTTEERTRYRSVEIALSRFVTNQRQSVERAMEEWQNQSETSGTGQRRVVRLDPNRRPDIIRRVDQARELAGQRVSIGGYREDYFEDQGRIGRLLSQRTLSEAEIAFLEEVVTRRYQDITGEQEILQITSDQQPYQEERFDPSGIPPQFVDRCNSIFHKIQPILEAFRRNSELTDGNTDETAHNRDIYHEISEMLEWLQSIRDNPTMINQLNRQENELQNLIRQLPREIMDDPQVRTALGD